MALAGEREGQRQAHLRRHPGHHHVGADGRPLHFQVRSDTQGWGAFWGQAGPLKHPLSSTALAIWQQRNKTHSEAGGGLCIGRLAIGMSKLGRQTKFESDQGRVFGDGDGVVGVVARKIEASLRNVGNVWERHKGCFPGLFLEACPLSHSHLRYSVKMGDRSVYKENTSVVVPVRRAFVHPKFSTVIAVQNDLALLRLHHPVNFTSNIQPICIPQENFQVEARTRCWVTGWGKTQEDGETSRQEANLGQRGGTLTPGVDRKATERSRKADCLVGGRL